MEQMEKKKSQDTIAPIRSADAPSSSNYLGGNYDPNYVPWARGTNKGKDKGKNKGKAEGRGKKDTPHSPMMWRKDLYDPDW